MTCFQTLTAAALMLVVQAGASGQDRVVGPEGLLMEMERWDARRPDDGSFAHETRERSASGRATVSRFFVGGELDYRFVVPRDATYHAWIRYGSKGTQNLGYRLTAEGSPPAKKLSAKLEPTGGFIGPGVWGWAPLFSEPLEKGAYVMTIFSVSMRPDCIYITTSDEPPTDEIIAATRRVILAPEVQALVDRPLVAVSPDWLDGAEEYHLPAWYEQYRVHAHTRLSLSHLNRDVFFNAARGFREMGVPVFARHIKTGNEGAWWPSAVGRVDPRTEGRNLAKRIIDNAHAQGQRILVYHRHMEDAFMAEQHPDWVCRDARGNALSSKRGDYMCFNSPYSDYFLTRALELVDLGADGFYFDEVHMPKAGCWCKYCQEAFREATGLEPPKDVDPDNPVWQKLKDFNNLTIERTFLKWRKALHERNPELVMLIGSNSWPTMADRQMTGRLFRIADAMKTEFSLPARTPASLLFPMPQTMVEVDRDAKIALGYTLARDAAGGRPPHIWCHGLLDETSSLYAAAGMMTHGCIANLDVSERAIPNMMFAKAFAMGRKVSPYLAGMRPIRFVAIHFSELARDRYCLEPDKAWEEVLYPTYGAYRCLWREGVPAGVVTDSQLADGLLDGYDALFLPAPEDLAPEMQQAVQRFQAEGGIVIERPADWRWDEGEDAAKAADRAFLTGLVSAGAKPPVLVEGGPEKMHAVAFALPDGDRITVALANEFAWVHTGHAPDAKARQELPGPPPPCRGVVVNVIGSETPTRVFDAVSGKELHWHAVAAGGHVDVPEFGPMAVIVLEYAP